MRLASTVAALLFLTTAGCGSAGKEPESQPASTSTDAATTTVPYDFALISRAFADNTPIPTEYTCHGNNVPPLLRWENAPAATESLALVVDDPDAPDGPFIHWVVTGIPPATTQIGEGLVPQEATVSQNSAGTAEYFGPCPPDGTGVHHYRFQLYALNKPVEVTPTTPAPEATDMIADAAIAEVTTVGVFGG